VSTMTIPREPTADECSNHAIIERHCWAVWYPQMGGYVGRAVAKRDESGCWDVWVWHDGEFPFTGSSGPYDDFKKPVLVHHCEPGQFIAFGQFLDSVG